MRTAVMTTVTTDVVAGMPVAAAIGVAQAAGSGSSSRRDVPGWLGRGSWSWPEGLGCRGRQLCDCGLARLGRPCERSPLAGGPRIGVLAPPRRGRCQRGDRLRGRWVSGSVATHFGPRKGGAGLADRRAERAVLDQVLTVVRAGESRVLVVHGEPGVGKSVLLDYLAGRASGCRVVRVAGM